MDEKKVVKRSIYALEIWNTVNPKYFNLVVKINNEGKLQLCATGSLTPGRLPSGVQKGKVPKGVKVFDYDNTITTVLEFADCMNIVNFVNNLDPTDKVDIYRRIPGRFDKSIVLQWNVKDNVIQNAVMYFNMSQNGTETKVMIPFGAKILLEFAKVIESYMNNMPMIKLFCNGIEGEYEKKSFTNTSAPSGNPDVEDSDY